MQAGEQPALHAQDHLVAMRTSRRPLTAVLLGLAVVASGCGGDDEQSGGKTKAPRPAIDPAQFTSKVDHPLVPLLTVGVKVYEGRERDPDTGRTFDARVVTRVQPRTFDVAGVRSAIVAVREYEDGELVESTRDYYAQRRDGSVFYMGEHVNDYEDGKIVGHDGQWFAGQRNAKPGLFMPAKPRVGLDFEQEQAPGVAEDRSTVVALGRRVTTPAGTFDDCIKTKDVAPLDNLTEFKYYCPRVGLVREDKQYGRSDLVSYRRR
jgi:hypothetical protein